MQGFPNYHASALTHASLRRLVLIEPLGITNSKYNPEVNMQKHETRKMAVAGEAGVLAALLAYALLSSLCGNPTESPVVYPNRKNIPSQCQGVEIQIGKTTSTSHKHLGFGRGVIHT